VNQSTGGTWPISCAASSAGEPRWSRRLQLAAGSPVYKFLTEEAGLVGCRTRWADPGTLASSQPPGSSPWHATSTTSATERCAAGSTTSDGPQSPAVGRRRSRRMSAADCRRVATCPTPARDGARGALAVARRVVEAWGYPPVPEWWATRSAARPEAAGEAVDCAPLRIRSARPARSGGSVAPRRARRRAHSHGRPGASGATTTIQPADARTLPIGGPR